MIMSNEFSMQARMIQALGQDMELVPATQFGAFAMKSLPPANSSTVHVEINNNRTGMYCLLKPTSHTTGENVVFNFTKFIT